MFLKLFKFKIEHSQHVIYYWLNILALPVLITVVFAGKIRKDERMTKRSIFINSEFYI